MPSWIRWCAAERLSACASVLAQTKSTPCTPSLDHVLDRVAAAAADADHLDLRAHAELFDHFDSHLLLQSLQLPCSLSIFRKYVLDVMRVASRRALSRSAAGRARAAGGRLERGLVVPVVHVPSPSEVAEEPVLGAAEQRLHRAGLLRRALAARARQARFLEQAHHRRRARVARPCRGARRGRSACPCAPASGRCPRRARPCPASPRRRR